MNRFTKKLSFRPQKLFSIAIFLCVMVLFGSGLSSVAHITAKQEIDGLKNSICQSAVHCYALEGFYPDQLSYLEEHYGLQYDKNKYLVIYEIVGSNLMPDVSVIPIS